MKKRHVIRLFLPALYSPEVIKVTFDERVAKNIYQDATLPAICEVLPDRVAHFPATYTTEQLRTTRRFGGNVHSMHDIPTDDLERFARAFFRHLSRKSYGVDAFFYHELRGVKNEAHRDVNSQMTRDEVLRNVWHIFKRDDLQHQINDRRFGMWVDVGYEAGIHGFVNLVRREYHFDIVKHFTGLADGIVERQLQKSSFICDLTAHLTRAAGFRVPPRREENQPVSYMNIYVTEKEPTYLKDAGHYAKFVLPTDVLAARNDDKENVSLIKSIHTIFLDTMKTLDYFPARFECRVDIKDIDHLELDVATAKQWMMSVQAKIWW